MEEEGRGNLVDIEFSVECEWQPDAETSSYT